MRKGNQTPQAAKSPGDDLEVYRQLLEIQREVAKMAKLHELTRRECDALRERLAGELIARRSHDGGGGGRLRRSASNLFQRFARGSVLRSSFRALKNKLLFLC